MRKPTPRGEVQTYLRSVAALATFPDACLIWPYSRDGTGYAQVWFNGKLRRAHRVLCELVHGTPPTPKHEAAHSCARGHDACINPGHLRWATAAENARDRVLHGNGTLKGVPWQSGLTPQAVRAIRKATGKCPQRELAERFGVSNSTISDVQRGRSYQHVGKRHVRKRKNGLWKR